MAFNQENDKEQLGQLAARLATGVVLPMVLKSTIELNIIDLISVAGDDVFLSPSEIANRIPTRNPDAPLILDRMLRLLASYGILKQSVRSKDDGGVERLYGAGPLCQFFTKNKSDSSIGPFVLLFNDKVLLQSWYHLNDVILEGGVPFNKAHGMALYEYPTIDQRFNKVFNCAMSSITTLIMKKILDVYRGFEDIKVLVDVGGGIGTTLNMITSRYPNIKGINYDLPHVVTEAPSYPGVEHVGGDMFKSVPKGDAIFMKWILHNWSDEHCLKLLKNCWEALPPLGKVIIVDAVLPEVLENTISSNVVLAHDLNMLAQNPGAKERTQKEFEALALKTGFLGCEVKYFTFTNLIMELHKKAE